MAESILSEKLPAGVNDRTWGVLTALSKPARERKQGLHIFLTAQEHVLGRLVKDDSFSFEPLSISGFHCKIYRRNLGDEGIGVFIKDSSSNGTYVNGQRLRKDSPDHRIQHGDVVSLPSVAELGEHAADTGFAFVFRDTSSGYLKRKQEDEAGKPDDNKRMKAAADGPVSLTDVRRFERSNQELRQKLESECGKNESLVAELRAAKASTDNMVKEAVDQCQTEYVEKIEKLQAELTSKSSALDEFSGKCVQLESTIEDLNKRLRAAGQSRLEAEEALKSVKANREELEKQIERERNQWKQERDEAELMHNAAVEKLRAEKNEELKRQGDAHSRQVKQLEDELAAQQEAKEDCRAQIDNLTKTLEEERQARMDSEQKAQELQILLSNEQRICSGFAEDSKTCREELVKALEMQQLYQIERDAARSELFKIQEEKDGVMNKLTLERERLNGAKDRIVLRETQLRTFQSTAEAISVLQQKQQEQLKAMMKTLADDDAEYANAMEKKCDDGEEDNKENVVKLMMNLESTQPNGDLDMEADVENYDLAQMATQIFPTQLVAPTQVVAPTQGFAPTQVVAPTQGFDATQIDPDATQAMPDMNELAAATQLEEEPVTGAGETEREQDAGVPDIGARVASASQKQPAGSMCTADLRASETLGSWVNETPPSPSEDEMVFEQPEPEMAINFGHPDVRGYEPGLTQVGNSDSLPAGGDNPGFNNTMASQCSPRLNLNEVAANSGDETEGDD